MASTRCPAPALFQAVAQRAASLAGRQALGLQEVATLVWAFARQGILKEVGGGREPGWSLELAGVAAAWLIKRCLGASCCAVWCAACAAMQALTENTRICGKVARSKPLVRPPPHQACIAASSSALQLTGHAPCAAHPLHPPPAPSLACAAAGHGRQLVPRRGATPALHAPQPRRPVHAAERHGGHPPPEGRAWAACGGAARGRGQGGGAGDARRDARVRGGGARARACCTTFHPLLGALPHSASVHLTPDAAHVMACLIRF